MGTTGPPTGPPFAALEEATAHLDPPFAVVDLAAFDRNAATLVERAGGKPVRLATKSVRSRELISRALGKTGELCEHVDTLHLVEQRDVIGAAPTYRGEGRTFL